MSKRQREILPNIVIVKVSVTYVRITNTETYDAVQFFLKNKITAYFLLIVRVQNLKRIAKILLEYTHLQLIPFIEYSVFLQHREKPLSLTF